MSGMGGPDEEALHAMILSENEQYRIRQELAMQALRPSATHCQDCDNIIPEGRRIAVAGCQYCVNCQQQHDGKVTRTKMLYHIL